MARRAQSLYCAVSPLPVHVFFGRDRNSRPLASEAVAQSAHRGAKHLPASPFSYFVYQQVRRLGLAAHRALGCRGVSRSDFRYDDRIEGTGGLICLEVNTQSGMTETSLLPARAVHAGISFEELVRWMVEDASLNC